VKASGRLLYQPNIKQQKIPRAIGTGDFLILSFCKEVIE
jgi:hypothetical protein